MRVPFGTISVPGFDGVSVTISEMPDGDQIKMHAAFSYHAIVLVDRDEFQDKGVVALMNQTPLLIKTMRDGIESELKKWGSK